MPSTRRSIIVSLLFTLFGGPGMVLVLFPWLITRFHVPLQQPLARTLAGVFLIVIGLLPLFDSIIRFVGSGRGTLMPAVPTEHLVVTGLYRYVRNPMYIGVLTALAGEALLLGLRPMWLYVAMVGLCMHLFVIFYEEPRLTRTYGDAYLSYRSGVPRWLPRLSPWPGTASSNVE